jgi:Domain of unknown function (DUF4118)
MRALVWKQPWNYLVAAGSVALTVVITLLIRPYLGEDLELLFVPAVLFSSLFCGLGPGLASGLLSVIALIYFFVDPIYSLGVDSARDIADVVVFCVVAISIHALNVAKLRMDRILKGLLPVCAWCRKIRREDQWITLETYARLEMNTALTHSICPDCRQQVESAPVTPRATGSIR